MKDTGLNGKVVLITGANHGIGAELARAFADEGAAVFATYFRLFTANTGDAQGEDRTAGEGVPEVTAPGEALYHARQALPADDVVRTIRDRGGQVAAMEADLADPQTIPLIFDRAEAELGPVEVLINNAASWEADTFIPSASKTRDRIDRVLQTIAAGSHDHHFAVNSRATALMMAEYARRHVAREARWGRIINVSTDGASCFPEEVSYGASKAALESYTRSAARELGRYGITANIVSLGPIQTGWITPELEKQIADTIPLGRVGVPDDVADVIVFLASEQARWLTGQLLYVGGGHAMPL
jgi:3-oxoacyl-[acyl-carrier protein] reductase